jgi:hypothetical protein
LHGADPANPAAAGEAAYVTALYSLALDPDAGPEQIARLAAPERRPANMKHVDLTAAIPAPEVCRQWLRTMVAAELKGIDFLETAMRAGKDAADRAQVLKRAELLGDGESSAQFLRYSKTACSVLFRGIDRLPKLLQRDAEGFFEDLAAAYDEPAAPETESDGDEEGFVAPADDLAAGEAGPSCGTQRECADEPSEDVEVAVEPTVELDLTSQSPDDDDPSVRNPAEPTMAATIPPDPPPDEAPVRRERTSDNFPVEEMTDEELRQFAPEMVNQEELRRKIDAIYGAGRANRDPPAEQPPAGDRGPPRS